MLTLIQYTRKCFQVKWKFHKCRCTHKCNRKEVYQISWTIWKYSCCNWGGEPQPNKPMTEFAPVVVIVFIKMLFKVTERKPGCYFLRIWYYLMGFLFKSVSIWRKEDLTAISWEVFYGSQKRCVNACLFDTINICGLAVNISFVFCANMKWVRKNSHVTLSVAWVEKEWVGEFIIVSTQCQYNR